VSFFSSIFGKHSAAPERPSVADGDRVYAIGDIHGRSDLLDRLFLQIIEDQAERPPATTRLIFLGDYVDRGPSSRQVIEKLMALGDGENDITFLMGNHEEMLLAALDGDMRALSMLDRLGGTETFLSYGIERERYERATGPERLALAREAVPEDHRIWIRDLADAYTNGNYLFVHAGIRPGVPLDQQSPSDLRWIRREFLDHKNQHEMFVVHGHSISTEIDERPNRLGIDTGAFQSGILTAVGLETDRRWFIQAHAD